MVPNSVININLRSGNFSLLVKSKQLQLLSLQLAIITYFGRVSFTYSDEIDDVTHDVHRVCDFAVHKFPNGCIFYSFKILIIANC
jgi:hypothetical protein